MSDEVLIVQTTLVLQGCPAFDCAGGDHNEIPDICIVWWKEKGWDLMQWAPVNLSLNSFLIKQKCAEYVNSLTEECDGWEQDSMAKNAEVGYIHKTTDINNNIMTMRMLIIILIMIMIMILNILFVFLVNVLNR